LLFERDVCAKFRESFPKFPKYESIPHMTYREALLTFQLEVSGSLLGYIYGSPTYLKRLDLVLAASEGDSEELAKQVDRIFVKGVQDERVAIIRHPEPDETAVGLYVDLPEIPEWTVFWKGKTPAGSTCPPSTGLR